MRVLIIGAGVAGLSCALALRRAGIVDLTIVERAIEVAAGGGTGIAIPPNGTGALAALGLPVGRLIAQGSRLRAFRFLDAAGRELSRANLTRLWRGAEQPYFAVHRHRVLEALVEALGAQTIELSTTAELAPDALDADRPAPARIAGPRRSRTELFDLVVGADGIRSVLREVLWPGVTARALGWSAWRCVLDVDRAEPETQVVHSGRAGVLLYIPIGGAQTYVYAARRQLDGVTTSAGGVGRALADRFGGFGAPRELIAALAALPDDSFHIGPLEEVPHELLPAAGRGRALLVGDALHASSPNMAQGVSLAVEDGLVLAEIASSPSDESIAQRFWRRRLPRIRHVQQQARKRDRLIGKRADSALFERVSNVIIRLRGADRLQRQAFGYLLDSRP